MTDLDPAVPGNDPDADRQLELEEAWRAAGSLGYDTDTEVDGTGTAVCPVCRTRYRPGDTGVERTWAVREPTAVSDDRFVVTMRCPGCDAPARAQLRAADLEPTPEVAEGETPGEVPERGRRPAGVTAERPLGEDRRFFAETGGGNLADRGSVLDEHGEDIRSYTGEPVETEEGWVLPQQQNVGPGNMAGGGEWPDPTMPPAQPPAADDQEERR